MKWLFTTLLISVSLICSFTASCQSEEFGDLRFTENQGQVFDQAYGTRPDILYYGSAEGIGYFFKKDGVSLQFMNVLSWKYDSTSLFQEWSKTASRPEPDTAVCYRLDINWLNSNREARLISTGAFADLIHFYRDGDPLQDVRSYASLRYEELYNGIDLQYYGSKGHLKYDFVVDPGADYSQIRIMIKGTSKVEVDDNGNLILATPGGVLLEEPPFVMQRGGRIGAQWLKYSDSVVGFRLDAYDHSESLVIDPLVRLWGTYVAGTQEDVLSSTATDSKKNVYVAGYTNSFQFMATSGAHQVVFGSAANPGWNKDGFLAKFDSSGVRVWATYYGDHNQEGGMACAVDLHDNVFLSSAGYSNGSSTVLATPGAYMTNGGYGTVAKFNSAGQRLWATYYHGECHSVATDAVGNIYVVGKATGQVANGVFASPGAHQMVLAGFDDGFIAKFDSAGQRLWSTYYGGPYSDLCTDVYVDPSNNVFVAGYTGSGSGIASLGSHQPVYSAGYDAFLVKFDSAGNRIWGSYYGDAGFDRGYSVTGDASGNVFLAGEGAGSASFTTTNCHQSISAGNYEGFLAKFSTNGVRLWGTIFGGSEWDWIAECSSAPNGDVVVVGSTGSSSLIAAGSSYQSSHGGDLWDAFIARFDSLGVLKWSTYYGGTGQEFGRGCALSGNNTIYVAGFTYSPAFFGTSGSFQDSVMGGWDGFLAMFSDCERPIPPIVIASPTSVCLDDTASISVGGAGSFLWYAGSQGDSIVSSGPTLIVPVTSVGTYSFFCEAVTCTNSVSRTMVTFTAYPTPTVAISGPASICSGASLVLNAFGSPGSYNWSSGTSGFSLKVTPMHSAVYSVTLTSTENCRGSATHAVIVNATPTLQVSSSASTICSGESFTMQASGASTYIWSNNVLGSTNPSSPTVTTTYTVTGISAEGCLSTAAYAQVVDACLGMKSSDIASDFRIVPNPAIDQLIVRCPDYGGPYKLKVIDAIGRILIEGPYIQGQRIDISQIPSGVYQMTFSVQDKQIFVDRLIKVQ